MMDPKQVGANIVQVTQKATVAILTDLKKGHTKLIKEQEK